MNRLEKIILEIRKQLLPYRHEQDIAKGCERWGVDEGDCLTSWVAEQIMNCRHKNRCTKKGMCVYYSYSDIAKKNFQICREIYLLLEGGEIECVFRERGEERSTAK